MVDGGPGVEPVHAPDHFIEGPETEFSHDLAHFLGDESEEVDDMLRLADEALAQFLVLSGDPGRTCIEVALAHHDAALGNQGGGGKTEFIGAQQRPDDDVAPGTHAAVHLHRDAPAQPVQGQCLVGFGQAQFPVRAGVHDRGQGTGAGAAIVAGNGDVIGMGLGNAGRDRADADLRHQLDRDPGVRVDVLQVVDQLCQVLDGVNIVVRRRRDQADPRRRIADTGDPVIDLVSRQLPTLAGLGALGHLDLEVVGIDQVFGGHAEAPRRYLLDGRTHGIAVVERLVTLGVLAALAGVGLAADPVHGDGEIGVRLPRDGTERHGAGGEAPDDLARRFDLVQGQRDAGALQAEQAAQVAEFPVALVDLCRKCLELLVIAGPDRVLQGADGFGRPHVLLATHPERIFAADIEGVPQHRVVAEGGPVAAHGFLADLGQADAFDGGRRVGEILVNERGVEADGIEDLRPAVGLIGGDAHLRHHLLDALGDRLDVAAVSFLLVQGRGKIVAQCRQGVEGEIGIDGLGPISGKQAEVVDLAGLAGLDDQPDFGPQALADQVVVYGRRRQKRRDRHLVGVHGAV